MRNRNRVATCALVIGLFSLSACDRWHHDRDNVHEARGDHDIDRHDDRARPCDADHRGDDCRDAERH
jgi:hypothetical protein